MVQGTLIGVIGTVLGVVGGIVLTLNLERILRGIEAVFGVQLLPEDVYYITGLPTDTAGQRRRHRSRWSRWRWPSSPRSIRPGAPRAPRRRRRCAMSEHVDDEPTMP